MRKLKLLGTLLLASMLTVNTLAIDLNINNKAVSCTQKPVMENGTTLVPLRVISENLGAEVAWDKATKTVTVIKGDKTIILTIGSKTAKVNGETLTLTQAPKVINGSTMLPIRFVSEQLNCSVVWDSKTQTVYVNSSFTTSAKVTKFKNPKIYDGVIYLSSRQMKQAFGVKFNGDDSLVSLGTDINFNTEREDFFANPPATNRGPYKGTTVNVNNTRYISTKENTPVVKDNQVWLPVEFYAEHLNSSVSYDEATKTLTVTNNGIKYLPVSKDPNHKCNGYVKLLDGTPVGDAEVVIAKTDAKGKEYAGEEIRVRTDGNGYYEFTTDWEYVDIVANFRNADTQWSGTIPIFLTTEYTKRVQAVSKFINVSPTNVEQFPTILLSEEKANW